jgi:tRNA nucleotidyltransferase (CCA-adding enzyme)
MTVKMYKVGGCVRDAIMNVKPKDIDYTCVASSFDEMKQWIAERGTIFLEKPEYLTIRAKMNDTGEAADYVLARKDGSYYDGRRPDSVEMGTLEDDLSRRDFTMNAIAQDEDGNLIDPFGGVKDIEYQLIKTVGKTKDRFDEDALRMLRAIRFHITKGFRLSGDIYRYLFYNVKEIHKVSKERVREEMYKCFKHNTYATLRCLEEFHWLRDELFEDSDMWLEPTFKG